MNLFFALFIFLFVLSFIAPLVQSIEGELQEGQTKSKRDQARVQGRAIKSWAKSLSESDYNATHWTIAYHQQPSNFFEHYVEQLSDLFGEKGAMVNFVMIGACDGTHDRTISERFIPNLHWRGVFVEPFEINHRDLVNFIETHGAKDRATILRAAATFRCNDTVVKMKRPTFEEKNKSLPHWMRRQIGSIVPFDKLNRPATGGWIFEYVPCVNGQKILQNWTYALGLASPSAGGDADVAANRIRLRPHVLKVDVEGHDYEVLMGFLHDGIPSAALPLLISFEAKSILKDFDRLKGHLEKRGYAVSHLANDGFALLKAEYIFSAMSSANSAVNVEAAAQAESNSNSVEEQEEEELDGEDGENSKSNRRKKRRNRKNKRKENAGEEEGGSNNADESGSRKKKRRNRKNKRRQDD